MNSKVTVESLVHQCVNEVGRPLGESTQSHCAKETSSYNPIKLGGPWGRRVPIGMVGRLTGGSLVIGN